MRAGLEGRQIAALGANQVELRNAFRRPGAGRHPNLDHFACAAKAVSAAIALSMAMRERTPPASMFSFSSLRSG